MLWLKKTETLSPEKSFFFLSAKLTSSWLIAGLLKGWSWKKSFEFLLEFPLSGECSSSAKNKKLSIFFKKIFEVNISEIFHIHNKILFSYLNSKLINFFSLLSVVVLNMAGGVYQNTVFGLAAKLPPRYTGAVVLGSVSKQNQGAFLVSRQGHRIWV